MKPRIPLLLLLLAACSREEEQANRSVTPEAPAPAQAAPAKNVVAVPVPDRGSPEAAALVLRDYFTAIAERRYADAYWLWSDGGRASGMGEAAFATSFAKFLQYHGTVGAPGRMEGAAGSSYIEFPVIITGRLEGGTDFKQIGTMTLRRVNDVPGATAEQLHWRIYKADLRANEVAAPFRFAGKWAADVGRCHAPWELTATSLKTASGTVCSFSKVSEAPGGYDIAASCTAGGAPKDDRIRLRYAESARALLVESGTLGDTGLVRCR